MSFSFKRSARPVQREAASAASGFKKEPLNFSSQGIRRTDLASSSKTFDAIHRNAERINRIFSGSGLAIHHLIFRVRGGLC
jgi:hypothetical protein